MVSGACANVPAKNKFAYLTPEELAAAKNQLADAADADVLETPDQSDATSDAA